VLYFFYLLYCVEAGIFLLMVPWSALWVRNSMAQAPLMGEYLMMGQVRGAISAFGFLLLLVAMHDFIDYCRATRET
jgi:hypothetical protein